MLNMRDVSHLMYSGMHDISIFYVNFVNPDALWSFHSHKTLDVLACGT
jgi:hypothetical protein